MKIRINKFLAHNGIGSRRKVEEMLRKGLVTVNDRVAILGEYIDDLQDEVRINGKLVQNINSELIYIKYNKPAGVLSSVSDNRGRTTVTQNISVIERVYPVGRLDLMSEGLIILTNDGDFAYKLTHPKFHIPRTYIVRVRQKINSELLEPIKNGGIKIEDKVTSKTDIKIIDDYSFEIVLYEGIKRQIRQSCRHVGLTVDALTRTAIGELKLENLKIGDYSGFSDDELNFVKSVKSL